MNERTNKYSFPPLTIDCKVPPPYVSDYAMLTKKTKIQNIINYFTYFDKTNRSFYNSSTLLNINELSIKLKLFYCTNFNNDSTSFHVGIFGNYLHFFQKLSV